MKIEISKEDLNNHLYHLYNQSSGAIKILEIKKEKELGSGRGAPAMVTISEIARHRGIQQGINQVREYFLNLKRNSRVMDIARRMLPAVVNFKDMSDEEVDVLYDKIFQINIISACKRTHDYLKR